MTTERPDPRLNAYRTDLASDKLKGVVDAKKFVEGHLQEVVVAKAPLKGAPRFDAPLDTEVIFGEHVLVLDEQGGWAWVQSLSDGYVGYVQSEILADPKAPASHTVKAPSTFIYPGPDIKLPPIGQLPMNARCAFEGGTGEFAELAGGGYVFAKHLAGQAGNADHFTDIAKNFVGTPYLWGGRTYSGIDCSGLVQMAMIAAGKKCLRDTDMQENSIGALLAHDAGRTDLAKGDLIFWGGHVGIMVDAEHLLHANAYHMQTVIEPYEEARLRIAAGDTGEVRTIRRPSLKVA